MRNSTALQAECALPKHAHVLIGCHAQLDVVACRGTLRLRDVDNFSHGRDARSADLHARAWLGGCASKVSHTLVLSILAMDETPGLQIFTPGHGWGAVPPQ